MARIRTIKPEFFTSEDIVKLSPLARLLYVALWCEADREGRMQWKPATFKLRYFPGDNCDILAMCDELTSSKLVVLYGDGLAYIPKFSTHQHVNPRESQSSLPDPVDNNSSTTRQHASRRVKSEVDTQGGKERKGKEDITPPTPSKGEDVSEAFQAFWDAWPKSARKVAKAQCWRKWQKRGCEDIAPKVIDAVRWFVSSPEWQRDDGAYIPAPLVWLNQARWDAPRPESAADKAAEESRRFLAEQEAHRKSITRPPAELLALAARSVRVA